MNFIKNKNEIATKIDKGKYIKYFICPECFKVTPVEGTFENHIDYYSNFEEKNVRVKLLNPDIQCYCDDCDDFMFECDDFMVDSVVKFNKAGYPTKFCCQGHHGDERTSDIGCLYSIPYIRFVDSGEYDWKVICDTLNQAILYTKWKEYFQINHMEKFLNNIEMNFPSEHPILVSNKDREIRLNSKIFDNLDVTVQEFDKVRFYFCTVINQVAYILSEEERSPESE